MSSGGFFCTGTTVEIFVCGKYTIYAVQMQKSQIRLKKKSFQIQKSWTYFQYITPYLLQRFFVWVWKTNQLLEESPLRDAAQHSVRVVEDGHHLEDVSVSCPHFHRQRSLQSVSNVSYVKWQLNVVKHNQQMPVSCQWRWDHSRNFSHGATEYTFSTTSVYSVFPNNCRFPTDMKTPQQCFALFSDRWHRWLNRCFLA